MSRKHTLRENIYKAENVNTSLLAIILFNKLPIFVLGPAKRNLKIYYVNYVMINQKIRLRGDTKI